METSGHFEQVGLPYCMTTSLLLLYQELSDTVSGQGHMRRFLWAGHKGDFRETASS